MKSRQTFRTTQVLGGFTLTEMLVATTLVVMIMMMFAQIYGSALGTMKEQRGMANNDQKARVVSEVIRNDLKLMTFKQVSAGQGIVPLVPGITPDGAQRGYFYYSENLPGDDTDDVLQFTVEISGGTTDVWSHEGDEAAFFGHATLMGNTSNPRNQPFFDGPYGSGKSQGAEVCYFLRHGTLYRRVLLIREPPAYVIDNDVQPKWNNGARVFQAGNPYQVHNGVFWEDFDYAVTQVGGALTFHGLTSLSNTDSSPNEMISKPWFRFGHLNFPDVSVSGHHGRPREYSIHNSNDAGFIGRFTLFETSSPDADADETWPGQFALDPEDHILNRSISTPVDAATGIVTRLSNGTRMGDDILLTGVESFNVEIFDRRANGGAGGFVNLGSTDVVSFDNNWNPSYGPRDNNTSPPNNRPNNVFDTWTAQVDAPGIFPGPAGNGQPPRCALRVPWTGVGWQPRADGDPYTVDDIGTVIFPLSTSLIGYRLYQIIDGIIGDEVTDEPTWGADFVTDVSADPPTMGVVWQRFDNRLGLEALRITVRYRDVQSNQPRQVTIVHSFVE